MKVTLIGKEIVSYKKKGTNEQKEGISLYYTSPKDGVSGLIGASLWLRKDSKFYNDFLNADLSKPVMANVVNEVPPGGRFPEITEIEIIRQ